MASLGHQRVLTPTEATVALADDSSEKAKLAALKVDWPSTKGRIRTKTLKPGLILPS